jgi:two-component system response regulator CpxR
MERVLVVDDDVELCDLVAEYLGPEGLEVEAVHDGAVGLARALEGDHALVVLDVMLPGMGGLDVLRGIREGSTVPILMLTARGDAVDRIVGLELGADDYLAKPFHPRELLARIRAVMRRTRPATAAAAAGGEAIAVGDLHVDLGARVARRAGEAVDLTSAEFDLLAALAAAAGRVVARDDLAERALGRQLSPLDRAVDMHVSNLRKKLGPHADGAERIRAVRGVGYIYALPSLAEGGPSA